MMTDVKMVIELQKKVEEACKIWTEKEDLANFANEDALKAKQEYLRLQNLLGSVYAISDELEPSDGPRLSPPASIAWFQNNVSQMQ